MGRGGYIAYESIINLVCRFLWDHASVIVGETLSSATGLIVKINKLIHLALYLDLLH